MSSPTRPPRDFTYINSRRKRPSEYEAVNLHVQPKLGNWWDKGNSYLRTPDGREAFIEESTALRHPDWHDFRDPCALWQRPYMRMQAEAERAIERLTVDVSPTLAADLDPVWAKVVLEGHYAVWSFVEYGLYRGMFSASREGLSDTVVASMLFETFDRARHSQDIVHWMLALEENLPGFDATGAKQTWLDSPRYQPLRRLVEEISFGVKDWGETIIATNLCFDPIISAVAVSGLLRHGPTHGDVVSKVISAAFDRDRRREADWTGEFVGMVTAADLPAAGDNHKIITDWIGHWTPKAVEAAAPIAEVYTAVPRLAEAFGPTLQAALTAQRATVSALGLGGAA